MQKHTSMLLFRTEEFSFWSAWKTTKVTSVHRAMLHRVARFCCVCSRWQRFPGPVPQSHSGRSRTPGADVALCTPTGEQVLSSPRLCPHCSSAPCPSHSQMLSAWHIAKNLLGTIPKVASSTDSAGVRLAVTPSCWCTHAGIFVAFSIVVKLVYTTIWTSGVPH